MDLPKIGSKKHTEDNMILEDNHSPCPQLGSRSFDVGPVMCRLEFMSWMPQKLLKIAVFDARVRILCSI